MFKINWREVRNRGQVLVLYALLIPLLFLFVGVALDLGWYYLNVSRLQNAADAAAVAGAQALANDLNSNANSTTTTTTDTSTSGNTTTNTTTTTTTTDTYAYKRLVGKYPADKDPLESTAGDDVAGQYVVKNLGESREIQALDADGNLITKKIIADTWNKAGDPEVTPTYSLYEDDDEFYYVVRLTEKIRHLFMPGWFGDMDAPVVAVALISKGIDTDIKTFIEEITKALEKAKNENVIVGNWEVQDKYKNSSSGSYKITIKPGEKLIDSSGQEVDEDNDGVADVNTTGKDITVTLTKSGKFYVTFDSEYYTGAWNHFQDFYNHYYLGDLYRKQMVVIKDDVIFHEDPNGVDLIDRNKTKGTIANYGKGAYGVSSSVAATSASINNDPNSSGYNPQHNGALKTYQDGITETATVGYPFTWKRLDSINIDFRPEVVLSGKWLSEDWDLELDDFTGVTFNGNKRWTTSGSDANKIGDSKIRRLRIHTSMNFEDPYKVREDVDKESEPDILWARIESEPMLNKPDVTDSSISAGLSSIVSTTSLNSVNQIILNFNQSNYNTSSQRYRPVIIFYDGPETYSIYSDYDTKNKFVRKSKPIIVNLNAPYRAILYVPNSPVAVIGEDKGNFKGFIMAKNYVQLKDDDDFIAAEDYLTENGYSDLIYTYAFRYFNNAERQWEYTREENNGKVQYRDLGGTKISGSVTSDDKAYRLKIYYAKDDTETDPADKKRYYKVVGKTDSDTSAANTYETIDGMKYIKVIEENGIDMYVDDYGEIQFEDCAPPTDCGEYDSFGRTDFSTHGYHLEETSSTNMLVSGN